MRGAFSEITGAGRPDGFTIEGNRQVAPLLNVWHFVVLDALLLERWPWTLTRRPISRERTTDDEYMYRYPMAGLQPPPIGAGPVGIFGDVEGRTPVLDWALRDNAIYYGGEQQIWVVYQYNAPPETWPDQFAEYVRLRLCASTAATYGESEARQADFARRAKEKEGQVVDSMHQVSPPKVLFREFATVAARGSGFGHEPVRLRPGDDGVLRAV